MGDGAPDPAFLRVDAEDSDSDTGASGRSAAGRIRTQAIDAAIERDEYTGEIHQADGADVAFADHIAFQGLLGGSNHCGPVQ